MPLPTQPPPAREDRPASAVLHDAPGVRIVAFHLRPGQRIPAHRSTSTVVVHVVEGSGIFEGENGTARLRSGESAVFEPGESHAIEAGSLPLVFLATLAPRPGS